MTDRAIVWEGVAMAGLVAVTVGAYMAHPAAGWIVGGLALLFIALTRDLKAPARRRRAARKPGG